MNDIKIFIEYVKYIWQNIYSAVQELVRFLYEPVESEGNDDRLI